MAEQRFSIGNTHAIQTNRREEPRWYPISWGNLIAICGKDNKRKDCISLPVGCTANQIILLPAEEAKELAFMMQMQVRRE